MTLSDNRDLRTRFELKRIIENRVALCFVPLALLLFGLPVRASVTINEFLANNGGGLQDEDLESPDWIEIYISHKIRIYNRHLCDIYSNTSINY